MASVWEENLFSWGKDDWRSLQKISYRLNSFSATVLRDPSNREKYFLEIYRNKWKLLIQFRETEREIWTWMVTNEEENLKNLFLVTWLQSLEEFEKKWKACDIQWVWENYNSKQIGSYSCYKTKIWFFEWKGIRNILQGKCSCSIHYDTHRLEKIDPTWIEFFLLVIIICNEEMKLAIQ